MTVHSYSNPEHTCVPLPGGDASQPWGPCPECAAEGAREASERYVRRR